jgi:putative copper export protein
VADGTYARIVNNFLHDLATGTWAACLLVLLVLSGQRAGMSVEAAAAVRAAGLVVFGLALAALAVIGVTGGIRIRYWRKQTSAAEVTPKRRALLVKHAAFAVVFGVGTVLAWTLAR